MLYFKNIKSGNIVEVTEQIANQLLRPQGKYVEIDKPLSAKIVDEVKKVTSKSKKKTVKKN